ncbi:TlpA family protein disulfide reductase [Hydrotalea flava]|uniref:TlpA family protein disulfide reductase n=1 Tax=Hydrotalea flava TaxID=714549 RepID=UPI0008303831|nr:redoxin family protein [Hydrotalea flava]
MSSSGVTFEINDSAFFMNDGTPFKLVFKYYDSIGVPHNIFLHKGQNFVPLQRPTLFIQNNDLVRTPYLVFPNTTVHIQLNWDGSITFMHADTVLMYSMNLFKLMLDSINTLTIKYAIPKSADSMHRVFLTNQINGAIDSLTNLQYVYLHHFTRQHFLTEDISDYFKRVILCLQLLSKSYLAIDTKTNAIWLHHLSDSLFTNAFPYSDNFFQKYINPYFIELCNVLFNYQCSGTYYRKLNDSATIYTLAHQLSFIPSKYIRNILTHNIIQDGLFRDTTIIGSNVILPNLKKVDTSNFLTSFINDSLLSVDLETKISLPKLLDQFHHKVILVDIWASWCGPCRADMPYLNKLADTLKSNDFVLLHLTIDRDVLAWLKASELEQLNRAFNYCFIEFDESAFNQKFSVYSIPRYLFIGKNGEVIHSNAPSPSGSFHQLVQLISTHLK